MSLFDDNNLQGAEGSLSPEASDAEGDTHNLPDTTPEELLGGHKMRHFQESYPDRGEGRGEFLFPARTRIIKGGFHQLGSLADISAVGIFPRPIIPGGRWKRRQGGLFPSTPAGTTSSPGCPSTSQRVEGARRIPRGPCKGSSHDGVVTRLGGRIARVLSRRKVRQAHIGRKSR